MSESAPRSSHPYQTLVGVGALLIGFVMAIGAMSIPSEAGYAGVGPNALPWLVSAAWVVAAVVGNASLITYIGFVLSCTLCFVLAVRGLRLAEGKASGGARQLALDAVTGILIAAPVFWLFTKLLAINLPSLAPGGWI